jgi:hypothetical protein
MNITDHLLPRYLDLISLEKIVPALSSVLVLGLASKQSNLHIMKDDKEIEKDFRIARYVYICVYIVIIIALIIYI